MCQSLLISITTGSFGISVGMFFLLFCLERPIYRYAFRDVPVRDTGEEVYLVTSVLQQFFRFKAPVYMALFMILGTTAALLRVIFYDFSLLPALVVLCGSAIIVVFGVKVPPAVDKTLSVSLEAAVDEIREALAPLVRLHVVGGAAAVIVLFLQLASVV